MNSEDEDGLLAEAIRQSLAESHPGSNASSRSPSAAPRPTRPLPQQTHFIDLTDDPEPPVKSEPKTRTAFIHTADYASCDSDDNMEDDDEDLKKALALSLAEASYSSRSPPEPVAYASISAPSRLFEVRQEIKELKQEERLQVKQERKQESEEEEVEVSTTVPASSAQSFGGLARAEMERERQERLKRKSTSAAGDAMASAHNEDKSKKPRSQDIPAASASASASHTSKFASASASASPLKATKFPSASKASVSLSASRPSSLSSPSKTPSSPFVTSASLPVPRSSTQKSRTSSSTEPSYPLQYPTATFRNTGIQGTQLGDFEIRFQDLVNKEHLVKAILTTFELDESWLEKHLPRSIPQCLISHWNKDAGEEPGFCIDGKVTYLHPPLNGFGTFHPKLMLLFYPTFCRVVVSSANLVSHDWLQMVNTVFFQDFVLRPVPVKSPEELGEFGATLHNYLKVMTVPEKALMVLRAVDFSTAKVLLIPAVQGSFAVAAEHSYGIAQLGKLMQSRANPNQKMEIEYQTSSLGKLTLRFLSEFHRAATGLGIRTRSKINVDERMPPIKVVFPTEAHVQDSRNGELGAGTVCFQSQYWADLTYPRAVMHDFECVGALRGSLMHSKLVLARTVQAENTVGRSVSAPGSAASGQAKCAGWFYIGSANFTESAWGSVTNRKPSAKSEGGAHVSIRNWELGIVYIIENEEEMQEMTALVQAQGLNPSGEQSFFGPLPVPYRRPLTPYTSRDRPWIR